MITMIINIAMIMVILAYIIEQSSLTQQISKTIYEYTNPGQKWSGQVIKSPFTCLPCATFWVVLIYVLFSKTILISLFVATIASILSKLPSIIIEKIKILILKLQ